MNVDVTTVMSGTKTWLHEDGFGKEFSTFGTKLKHFAHGGVAINISVAAFNVWILLGVKYGNSTVGIHEAGLGHAAHGAFIAVGDIGLGGLFVARFH